MLAIVLSTCIHLSHAEPSDPHARGDWIRWHLAMPDGGYALAGSQVPESAYNTHSDCAASVVAAAARLGAVVHMSDDEPYRFAANGRSHLYYCLPQAIDPRTPKK